MFTDKEFVRDKASDAYKLVKPTEGKKAEAVDSADGSEGEEHNLNKIFSGKGEHGEDSDAAEQDFESRLTKEQRKKQKRGKTDKILKGKGYTNSSLQKKQESSKPIKKPFKKSNITDKDVRQKIKNRRMVVPTSKLK